MESRPLPFWRRCELDDLNEAFDLLLTIGSNSNNNSSLEPTIDVEDLVSIIELQVFQQQDEQNQRHRLQQQQTKIETAPFSNSPRTSPATLPRLLETLHQQYSSMPHSNNNNNNDESTGKRMTRPEFLALLTTTWSPLPDQSNETEDEEDDVEKVFRLFDVHQNQCIGLDDLQAVAEELGEHQEQLYDQQQQQLPVDHNSSFSSKRKKECFNTNNPSMLPVHSVPPPSLFLSEMLYRVSPTGRVTLDQFRDIIHCDRNNLNHLAQTHHSSSSLHPHTHEL